MQNKKRLHRHLLLIYIIYFAALIVGFAASFVPDFSRGWRDAQDTLEIEIPQGGIRSYYVSAPGGLPNVGGRLFDMVWYLCILSSWTCP